MKRNALLALSAALRHAPAAEAAAIRARAAAIAGDPAEDAIVRAAAVSLCNPARSIVMPLD
jgi:hypothetical protein